MRTHALYSWVQKQHPDNHGKAEADLQQATPPLTNLDGSCQDKYASVLLNTSPVEQLGLLCTLLTHSQVAPCVTAAQSQASLPRVTIFYT